MSFTWYLFHSSPSSFSCPFQYLQFLRAHEEKMQNCWERIYPTLTVGHLLSSGSRVAHMQIYLDIFTCANPHFFQLEDRETNKQSDLSSLQTIILLNLLWFGQARIYPAAELWFVLHNPEMRMPQHSLNVLVF